MCTLYICIYIFIYIYIYICNAVVLFCYFSPNTGTAGAPAADFCLLASFV